MELYKIAPMRKLQFLSTFLILFTAFGVVSCGDVEPIDPTIVIPTPNPNPNPNPNPDPNTPGVFKVDFDGQTYTASTTIVYLSGGSIILQAINPSGDSFGMILDGTTEGSYPTNENIVAYTEAGEEYGWSGYHPFDFDANTGTVIVTDVDTVNKTISGTFAYTGYWSDWDNTTIPPKQFTNGIFTNLPYVSQNPTNDTFYAKVNGVEFVDTDILVVEVSLLGQEFYGIGASNAADQSMTVDVRTDATVGTYPITGNFDTDVVQLHYALNQNEVGGHALTGTVTITEKTASRIKGTFSGTVIIDAVPYVITAGAFDVAY